MVHPLTIRIDPIGWKLFAKRKADPAFRKFQTKVFARDNNTCQFCSFQSDKYFDVINKDGNYNNNKIANMLSACAFCVQCNFIEEAGKNYVGGGRLIYAPELTQNQLNSLCHVLFYAIANKTDYQSSATSIYRNFKFASKTIEEKFGKDSRNPAVFASLLIESSVDLKKLQESSCKDVRLLPSEKKFQEQITSWTSPSKQDS